MSNNLTHSEQQFPLILQKGTIMATFCNSLRTTNVEVDSIAHVFDIMTSFYQCVGITCTELHKQQKLNALVV